MFCVLAKNWVIAVPRWPLLLRSSSQQQFPRRKQAPRRNLQQAVGGARSEHTVCCAPGQLAASLQRGGLRAKRQLNFSVNWPTTEIAGTTTQRSPGTPEHLEPEARYPEHLACQTHNSICLAQIILQATLCPTSRRPATQHPQPNRDGGGGGKARPLCEGTCTQELAQEYRRCFLARIRARARASGHMRK